MSRLRRIDRGLAIFTWLVSGALVLMLFIGPQLIADDQPAETSAAQDSGKGGATGTGGSDEAAQLFVENCGSCHTLGTAGTSGSIGPSLDGAGLNAEEVASTVTYGRGAMPAFGESLDPAQIEQIAEFVATSSSP